MATTEKRDLELVATVLPQILAMADRFEERAAAAVCYRDFMDKIDWVIGTGECFADDEFRDIDPLLYEGAHQFKDMSHRGFEAMGKYILVDMLAQHPEILALGATRARDALWRVVQGEELGTDWDRKLGKQDAKAQGRAAAYVDRVLNASGPPPGSRRDCTLFVAPNCEGDILSHPPRIVRDAEGFQRVELKGFDGWDDHGVVEEVTRMERYGLVLVATDSAAYLMTTEDFDTPIE